MHSRRMLWCILLGPAPEGSDGRTTWVQEYETSLDNKTHILENKQQIDIML